MSIVGQIKFIELLSHDDDPDWKVQRYPFTDASPELIGVMQPGYLVKFNGGRTAVLPALAADDATLEGIIVDLPDPQDDPLHPTVAVALAGSFNMNRIHYANAHSQTEGSETALSAAAIARLRDMGIFLEPTVGFPALATTAGVPAITSSLTSTIGHGAAYTYTITASNNPTSFHATNLPAGLSLNSATGVISGTAPVAGTYTIQVSATNPSGTTAPTAALVLTVT